MSKKICTLLLALIITPQFTFASTFNLTATETYNPVDDFKVTPAGSAKHKAVDETNCNSSDYVFAAGTDVGDRQVFVVGVDSVPNGSAISAIEVIPCMSANDSAFATATARIRARMTSTSTNYLSSFASYTVIGQTPQVLGTTTFYIGTSTPLVKDPTSELIVGFELSNGGGVRVSHFKVNLIH